MDDKKLIMPVVKPLIGLGQIIKVEDDKINSIVRWLKLRGFVVVDHFYYHEDKVIPNATDWTWKIGEKAGYSDDKFFIYGDVDISLEVSAMAAGTTYQMSVDADWAVVGLSIQSWWDIFYTQLNVNTKATANVFFKRVVYQDKLVNYIQGFFTGMGTATALGGMSCQGIGFIIK